MSVCTQRRCINFEQAFYLIRWKDQWSNIIWRWWVYHRNWNISYLWLPMFWIICTSATWAQHMPKMGATVTTWDLHWTLTSAWRNSITCSQSKNSPRFTSISYCLQQFIQNSSIYEQKTATYKLGWARQKLTRDSNKIEIQSGEDLALYRGRFRWQRFYPRTQ